MTVGHRRHIWETAAGVCSVPSPGACGESVMARLSAGPSPVIRRVNTAPGSGFWGGGVGGSGGGDRPAPVLLLLELSGSNFGIDRL